MASTGCLSRNSKRIYATLSLARMQISRHSPRPSPANGRPIRVSGGRQVRSVLIASWNKRIQMTAPWQRSFPAFAGPGIAHPSNSLRVSDGEAASILAKLATSAWSAPVHIGAGRHAGYTIRHAREASTTALFSAERIVGFYAGSYLWIAGKHRGIGLSTPLILAAAEQRGGTIMPPGVVLQGYTPAGLAAHRAAHTHAVLTALARGVEVPPAVRQELETPGYPATHTDQPGTITC